MESINPEGKLAKEQLKKGELLDIVLGGAKPAGEANYKNMVKCSFSPVCSEVHFSMYKTRTPTPATNTTTTPTQDIPKAMILSVSS